MTPTQTPADQTPSNQDHRNPTSGGLAAHNLNRCHGTVVTKIPSIIDNSNMTTST